jgi:hypothetical protein
MYDSMSVSVYFVFCKKKCNKRVFEVMTELAEQHMAPIIADINKEPQRHCETLTTKSWSGYARGAPTTSQLFVSWRLLSIGFACYSHHTRSATLLDLDVVARSIADEAWRAGEGGFCTEQPPV